MIPDFISLQEKYRRVFPAVMALPTTFVLDRDGNLTQKNVGMLNAKETRLAPGCWPD